MFNAILMPIDGTPLSYKPLDAALALARTHHARLVFLSVAEPRLFNASDAESAGTGAEAEQHHVAEATASIEKAVAAAQEAQVPCEAAVGMSRIPSEAILAAAERYQCDIIVMATRGRLGVLDTAFGESITQEVLRKSPVPVLVFP
ncbi:MAG TPA: universal stress protein [Noviherbaspirillum sp.]|jgi:nucleotide-binding universal stress UspA family protein|uniref:universal stress protein n=1 Tax=Noviherbaspirillum sp. TaxID=1926288 RepID=UPI002F928206